MLDHIQEVLECMKRNADEFLFNNARHEMEAGEALRLNRQKIIKLADRFEPAWLFVKEYEADKLTDNKNEKVSLEQRRKRRRRHSKGRKSVWMSSFRNISHRVHDSTLH
eukprot:Em0114g1a